MKQPKTIASLANIFTGGDYRGSSGVAGFSVGLDCDVTPRLSDDHLLLILWYKTGQQSPIYT